jgi:SAM-dependent methyltransferase
MNVSRTATKARTILKQEGLGEFVRQVLLVFVHIYAGKIPLARFKWNAGLRSEMDFWDAYFRTKGLQWPETYMMRLDPTLPLQPRPSALLPPQEEVRILDVGAGPLSYLGKTHPTKRIHITPVDPLAHQYDRIIKKYQVHPVIQTQKLAAEKLTRRFSSNTFDLVFARNCIDHSYDPEKAIREMIEVVKSGHYVLLEHAPNEAENEGYAGLHQWNFSMSSDGDFIIRSKTQETNMTRKYAGQCKIECEMGKEEGVGDWLITRIQKHHYTESVDRAGT